MSASTSDRTWWFATPILLFFLFTGLFWPFLDNETRPVPQQEQPSDITLADALLDSVKVASWDWRDARSGDLYAVWGLVRNESSRNIAEVILELRTEDADQNTIARYGIRAHNLPAGQTRPFRGDVPNYGNVAKGFLEVRKIIP